MSLLASRRQQQCSVRCQISLAGRMLSTSDAAQYVFPLSTSSAQKELPKLRTMKNRVYCSRGTALELEMSKQKSGLKGEVAAARGGF
ncbi:hypothetical protein Zmor_015344 [Zophobas morio]|uniref:Uncharacterized protein n=1 Tax=Zophobas morio TaxID=2755281 RepID=A0AA38MGG5_9CUCU|nr:hypothetical protein Zmor_015344 [Zophobas morio]